MCNNQDVGYIRIALLDDNLNAKMRVPRMWLKHRRLIYKVGKYAHSFAISTNNIPS